MHGRMATGHPGIDAALGGGLMRGRLHVIGAAAADAGAGIGFAAGLGIMLAAGAPLMWIRVPGRTRGVRLHGAGLLAHGGDPGALLLLQAPDLAAASKVAEDGARCASLGALVLELPAMVAMPDRTAQRRLLLAAGQSGVTLLMLALGDGPLDGSAAETRWQVAAAPSRALAGEAPGHPALDIMLQRQRSGPAGQCWRVEWSRDARSFEEAPVSGAGHAVPADRPLATDAGNAGQWRIAASG